MKISFELVSKIQVELAATLNSALELGMPQDLVSRYLFQYSRFVNNTLETFVFLNSMKRRDAARLLLRPALEVTFRMQSIKTKPSLLYQTSRWEFEERKKWLNALTPEDSEPPSLVLERGWAEFSANYREFFPDHPEAELTDRPLSAFEAAKSVGITRIYEVYYRLYGGYCHGNFHALTGSWDYLDAQDENVAAHCLMNALQVAIELGGKSENFFNLLEAYTRSTKCDGVESNQ